MKKLSVFVEGLFDDDFDVNIDDIVFDKFADGLGWAPRATEFKDMDKYVKEIQPRLMDFIKSFPQIDEATALNPKKTQYCCKIEYMKRDFKNDPRVLFTFIGKNKTVVYINKGYIHSDTFWSRKKIIRNDFPDSWQSVGIFKITPEVFDKVLWLIATARKFKN